MAQLGPEGSGRLAAKDLQHPMALFTVPCPAGPGCSRKGSSCLAFLALRGAWSAATGFGMY